MRRPKVRDRAAGPADEKVRFSSAILPGWARRSRSLDALLPVLYLRGEVSDEFEPASAWTATLSIMSRRDRAIQ